MTIQHPPNPAWKAPFAAAISSQPVTFFQLATVSESLVPRCRTLTYAGFFGETPYAGASGIPASEQNPSGAESDVLLVASDARSSKFAQLQVSSSVEAVFFIAAQWTQFRVRGSAYPISFGARCGELERRGREHVEAHMARPDGWDWDKEIRKVWERQDEKMMKSKFPATVSPVAFVNEGKNRLWLIMCVRVCGVNRPMRPPCQTTSACW